MDVESLEYLRYVFQRILVPIVVIIGCLGNSISCIVLTRRRMRCTTNVYLTALAAADILYLLFVLYLSFKTYPSTHRKPYEFFLRTMGLAHWICDAAGYTSVYLTVSFTVERYIAVCHPIRGQVLCTESRAKKVIAVVFAFCFLSTISTAFEYQIDFQMKHVDVITGKVCQPILGNDTVTEMPLIESTIDSSETYDSHFDPNATDTNAQKFPPNCELVEYLDITLSDFGNNESFRAIFFAYTVIVFTFLPIVLLVTFNFYLVRAVHRSSRLRKKMTNNSRPGDAAAHQENRITIILISVCVLFFILQSPTAGYMIYDIIERSEPTNLTLALGNIFNFLITLNAACNFILYCVLSDKYRQTVKDLFVGKKRHGQWSTSSTRMSRNGTVSSLRYSSRRFPNNESKSLLRAQKSLSPSEFSKFDQNDGIVGEEIQMQPEKHRHSHDRENMVNFFIANETNLHRSQSLELKTDDIKHSPFCNANPRKFEI